LAREFDEDDQGDEEPNRSPATSMRGDSGRPLRQPPVDVIEKLEELDVPKSSTK
jgi:hypothetical protein